MDEDKGASNDRRNKQWELEKGYSFCGEEESILRDDLASNLQGLTLDMKSYCVGVLALNSYINYLLSTPIV